MFKTIEGAADCEIMSYMLLLSAEHNAKRFSYIFIFTLKGVSHTEVCSTLLCDLNAKIDIQRGFPATKQT